jgi:predicted transcriptional regulator
MKNIIEEIDLLIADCKKRIEKNDSLTKRARPWTVTPQQIINRAILEREYETLLKIKDLINNKEPKPFKEIIIQNIEKP